MVTVRARGSVFLVTFDVETQGEAGPWLEARSLFLLSDEAAAEAEEKAEPDPLERGSNDAPAHLGLPAVGDPVEAMTRSASRADLVRYAGATREYQRDSSSESPDLSVTGSSGRQTPPTPGQR